MLNDSRGHPIRSKKNSYWGGWTVEKLCPHNFEPSGGRGRFYKLEITLRIHYSKLQMNCRMNSMWVQHTHFSGSFGQWGPDQFGDLRSSLQPSAEALLPQPWRKSSSSSSLCLSVEKQLLWIVLWMARDCLRLISQ